MARGRFQKKKLKEGGEFKLTAAENAKALKAIAHADSEFVETRVNFRWGETQVEIVKRAAEAIGVPYQTYIKQVVYRQALSDLKEIESVLGTSK